MARNGTVHAVQYGTEQSDPFQYGIVPFLLFQVSSDWASHGLGKALLTSFANFMELQCPEAKLPPPQLFHSPCPPGVCCPKAALTMVSWRHGWCALVLERGPSKISGAKSNPRLRMRLAFHRTGVVLRARLPQQRRFQRCAP